jgi:hypothetical protein
MAGWGELPFPESDLELSMTKIDGVYMPFLLETED